MSQVEERFLQGWRSANIGNDRTPRRQRVPIAQGVGTAVLLSCFLPR